VAGVHLVCRAGGTATALDGEHRTAERTGLVVSNGQRDEAVREVALRGADERDRARASRAHGTGSVNTQGPTAFGYGDPG
jgi:hypothetical protein